MYMFRVFLVALLLAAVAGFTPSAAPLSIAPHSTSTSLNAFDGKAAAAAALAGLLLVGSPDASFADSSPVLDSSLTVAARSGGRAGGRSSYRAPSRAPSRGPSRSYGGGGGYRGGGYGGGVTIMPMVSPFGYSPFGYGYSPLNGIGLGYGLGAASRGSDTVRDYKQQVELDNEKQQLEKAQQELEETKAKEAELELRLQKLEGK